MGAQALHDLRDEGEIVLGEEAFRQLGWGDPNFLPGPVWPLRRDQRGADEVSLEGGVAAHLPENFRSAVSVLGCHLTGERPHRAPGLRQLGEGEPDQLLGKVAMLEERPDPRYADLQALPRGAGDGVQGARLPAGEARDRRR
jgi:hypothetical protein